MVDLNPTMSVITLHGLNILIKRQRLSDWKLKIKKKAKSSYMCLQELYFKYKDTDSLKVKEWKRYTMQIVSKESQSSYSNARWSKFQNKK